VSAVRFSPNSANPIFVSSGWDKLVKVCFLLLVGFWLYVKGGSVYALYTVAECKTAIHFMERISLRELFARSFWLLKKLEGDREVLLDLSC
jgi:hypothetical protein